ncbi:MAG: DUF1934 domain-containing protein [Oscillospiraceae bacterium]|nr:DUF1934 domain-containing protein [Oscillospiraceae bacterium]MBQ7815804.1 DUF1934 domain-containing protein [Oscillospiraceae bacterium]
MQENYLISIHGSIVTDGEPETVDLTTTGAFYKKDDKYYVCYNESAATGFDGSKTCVKVWDNGASITRFGKYHSCLMIEKGITNLCNYDTPAGSLVLDINGVEIDSQLSEKGGDINLAYTLNSGGLLISENSIKMNIKEL